MTWFIPSPQKHKIYYLQRKSLVAFFQLANNVRHFRKHYMTRDRIGAVSRLDQEKNETDIETYVRRACARPDVPETFDAELFLNNLLRGVCKPGAV
jgi:hypothetical protein